MEFTQEWGKLHNAECHNLYPSPVTMVKSRRIRWKNSYINTDVKEHNVFKHILLTFKIR